MTGFFSRAIKISALAAVAWTVVAWTALSWTVVAWTPVAWTVAALPPDGDPELGRRIYTEGLSTSGEPVVATLGGAEVSGQAFACVTCHRPSGYGTVEGASPVPPITGEALFAPRRLDRADNFRELYQEDQSDPFYSRVRDPRMRPAYDLASLDMLLRQGIDPAERTLSAFMPRYSLDPMDLEHLAAFLKTLGDGPAPGIETERIHFATIVGPEIDKDRESTMLQVMRAYFRRKNAALGGLRARPGHSPNHRADFADTWRDWELHEWRLEGSPDSWGAQLRTAYARQPVFAVVGGLAGGSWQPIHDFCESEKIPCLFPNTNLPALEGRSTYSLYLSRGLIAEAELLAKHLAVLGRDDLRIVQIHDSEERSKQAAEALATALSQRKLGTRGFDVETHRIRPPLNQSTWNQLTQADAPTVLISWLQDESLANRALAGNSGIEQLYLSGSLLGAVPAQVSPSLHGKVRMTWPYVIPGQEVPRIYRVRAWLRSRGLASGSSSQHERLQLDTFFTLSVVDHALGHLVTSYDRDYFIELVEHETENTLNPGVYPRLSLGPGQRFASKACSLVTVETDGTLLLLEPGRSSFDSEGF